MGVSVRLPAPIKQITSPLRRLELALEKIARQRLLCCVVIALLTPATQLLLLPLHDIPKPAIHDEFSYLLAGETFALGRLTNPTHPLWPFFETMHVNMQPTYASKYPPGQALFLAVGLALFGNAWYGVWLSVALMCGVFCWMLQGWLPPKYALLGGLYAFLQFGISHYWVDSYWGGAVTATGGALLLGATPRLVRRPGPGAAAAAALGCLMLAITRPYEGGVWTLSCLLVLWWRARKERAARRLFRPAVIATFVGIILPGVTALGYYNYAVTGDPLTLPYSINQQRYAVSPVFWILPPTPPQPRQYRDEFMRRNWEDWDGGNYTLARKKPYIVLFRFLNMALETWTAGAAAAFLMPLTFTLLLIRLWDVRAVLFLLSMISCGLLIEKYLQPHYAAPAAGAIVLLSIYGLRLIRIARLGNRDLGLLLCSAIVALSVYLAAFTAIKNLYYQSLPGDFSALDARWQVEKKLTEDSYLHVVFVRYSRTHDMHKEIVYNGPDIDSQKVVWAIDRGRIKDLELIRYYPRRKIWLLRPDPPEPALEPYAGQ